MSIFGESLIYTPLRIALSHLMDVRAQNDAKTNQRRKIPIASFP